MICAGFWLISCAGRAACAMRAPGGYIGLVSTYGLMWGLLAVIAAHGAPWSWGVFGVTVLLRLAVALAVGKSVLQDAHLLKNLWLLPRSRSGGSCGVGCELRRPHRNLARRSI